MKRISILVIILLSVAKLHAQKETTDSIDIFRSINLDSVVVTGRVPQVTSKGSVVKVSVKNTVLEKLGDAVTMLANTPGLHKENNAIKVNGYGDPIYVLDGRILKNADELRTLQADNIRHIEIDKRPSAEFSSTGQPVVRIYTIKHTDDYVFLSIGNAMRQTRRFMDSPSINLRGKLGKVSASLSYSGTFGGAENKETYFRDLYYGNGSVFHVIQRRDSPFDMRINRLRFALDYNLNSNNRLGVFYMYGHNKIANNPFGNNSVGYDTDLTTSDISSNTTNRQNLHNISAEYSYTNGKQSFRLTEDLAFNAKKSNGNVHEAGMKDYNSFGKSNYTSTSTHANYTYKWAETLSLTMGARYNYVKSTADNQTDATFIDGGKYFNNIQMTERNPEAYVSLSGTIGKFTFLPEVCYQYVHRSVNSNSGGSDESKSQHYSSIVPALTVKYLPDEDWNISLSCRHFLTQPDFSMINAGLALNDSLYYSVGNTNIRATRTTKLNLDVTWKDFSLSANYTHEHAPIESVMTQMDQNSNILIEQSINFSSYSEYSLALSYSHTFRKLSLYADAEGYLPQGEYTFLSKTYKANKAQFIGQLNISYRFNKNFSTYANYTHQGYNVRLTKSQKPVNSINIGATVSLIRNRLNMHLAFTDILGKENYNNLTYAYGNVVNGTYGKNDSRGVLLSVSYRLFNKNVNVEAKSHNNEILNRM